MVIYKIFYCPRCKIPLYCPQTQKTKQCPKCEKRIMLKTVNILKNVNNLQDAIYIVQNIKVPKEIRKIIEQSTKKSPLTKNKKERFLDLIRIFQKKSESHIVDEKFFLEEAKSAGFSEKWISMQLFEFEKSGRLIRPQKNCLEFII